MIKRAPKQNKRFTARKKARKRGARQRPALHEHMAMMGGRKAYDPDNDGDTDAYGASDAAGETAAP